MCADLAGQPDPIAAGPRWSFGDRVVHERRPEWGSGLITAVEPAVVDGEPTQRLTIRFDRAGLKKLAASAAALRPAGEHAPSSARGHAQSGKSAEPASEQPVDQSALSDTEVTERLLILPEAARDPFRSLAERFEASVRLYRYRAQGGSLLDWAAAQTGLADPLSRQSRHDLEASFARFRRRLDAHTRGLALELVKTDPAAAKRILAQAPDDAKSLMRRIAGGR